MVASPKALTPGKYATCALVRISDVYSRNNFVRQLQAYADESTNPKGRGYVMYFKRWKDDSNVYITLLYHIIKRLVMDKNKPRARTLYVQADNCAKENR